MKIVFATNNQHKLQEVRQILGDRFQILSLADIGCHVDIPETGTTLEENALIKARYVWDNYHLPCFADDTGLEVDALDGAPGVYSARYASLEPQKPIETIASIETIPPLPPAPHDSEANMARLLRELGDSDHRSARFRTVFAFIYQKNVCPCGCTGIKQEHLFEGIVEGEILRERSGVGGFGYDPVFRPDGFDRSFAEMTASEKNAISHRGRATQKLCAFLRNAK